VTIREFDNEAQNWQIVVNLLKDAVTNDYLLNPPAKAAANPSADDVGPIAPRTTNDLTRVGIDRKQFQICPRAFPFIPPSLMTKMISLSLNVSKLFKTYAKFIYSRSISFRTNLMEIFKKSCLPQTRLLEYFRCELCRYSFKSPSVVFLFQDSFYIVTTTALTQDRSDFQFDGLDLFSLQFFIESVFMNHWGDTQMFAARMVITVRFQAIIYSEFTPEKGFTIWSLENGFFT
jgi:hypothetical protein